MHDRLVLEAASRGKYCDYPAKYRRKIFALTMDDCASCDIFGLTRFSEKVTRPQNHKHFISKKGTLIVLWCTRYVAFVPHTFSAQKVKFKKEKTRRLKHLTMDGLKARITDGRTVCWMECMTSLDGGKTC